MFPPIISINGALMSEYGNKHYIEFDFFEFQISTLEILNSEHIDHLSEDQIFFMQQAARNVCVALKKYFDTHMAIKISQLIRSHTRHEGGSPHQETPSYKVKSDV